MKDLQFGQENQTEPDSCSEIVVVAWNEDQLVLVRRIEQSTWAFPGCEMQDDEDVSDAAERVMYEQTGAEEFQLYPICTYSYQEGKAAKTGMLFTAEVLDYDDLPSESEIEEILLFDELPDESELESPFLHPRLYEFVLDYLKNSVNNI